ncbi:MAG: nickel pincer cofactor biosynthesis protein LarC [candidate division Zixibacteria bacterium]|nr:nickel pincer cofactor biosynthesis protein LarC [candidate division Zixibacteria bacterium]
MKIAYFDMICGAAGDIIIASMLDAGLNFEKLKAELSKLPIDGYRLKTEKATRHHIAASRFDVEIEETRSHRNLKEIERIIERSGLKDKVKSKAKLIFRRLAEAEAKVHGETVDTVHFHEVGMVDAIIDICGAVIGLDLLGIEEVYCSSLTVGRGLVETRHGTMPVPAPATGELIAGFPVRQTGIETEILTPTGAAILTTLASFDNLPEFNPGITGYGAGKKEIGTLPNLLRLYIGETGSDFVSDQIALLETNLDRTTPEQIGYLMDNLFAAGALDVYITPIQMKKNRPGQILSVLCQIMDENKMAEVVFLSGGTLGIRRSRINRWKLAREEKIIKSKYGEIPVKLANYGDKILYFPEYEFVARAANKAGKNFDEIYFEIISQLRKEL